MTPDEDDPVTRRVLLRLAGYLRPDLPPAEVSSRLVEMLQAIGDDLDAAEMTRYGEALAAARERGQQIRELEQLTAFVARALLARALRAETPDPGAASMRWISRNVAAFSSQADRVRAIWRVAAGLSQGNDAELQAHALASARAGRTQVPVPTAAPANPDPAPPPPPPNPVKEKAMLDLIQLRRDILSRLAINPAGLPASLRSRPGQEVWLDAVIQGVVRQQHFAAGDEKSALMWSAAAAGLMLVDGHYNPSDQRFYAHLQRAVVELAGSADEATRVEIDSHGLHMFAPDDRTQRIAVYEAVLGLLRSAMPRDKPLFLQSFARVARRMADRWEDHAGDETVMGAMAASAYATDVAAASQGGGGGAGGGIANVELPPLNDPQGYNDEIEPDNVRAVSTVYVTYQLEFALKAGARILDLFVAGLLPIPANDGSARELDQLYWDQDDLLDEASRRSVYARVLGAPGGEIAFDIQPNVEFNTHLMRVVSAVSEHEREQSALTHFDNAARGRRFQSTRGEFVRKAIRDFGANTSLRGWAGTAFTAERMANHLRRTMRILGLPSVRNAFGVTTPWQVIERVSQREFGITVNTVLHRTLAVETQTIMRIIADHHTVWSQNRGRPLFPETGQADSDLPPEVARELMVACQHFRAVTGLGDAMLDEYATPVETQPMPSLPDMGAFGGFGGGGGGGGGMPSIDTSGIDQLREMVSSGQTPSLDQLRAMLPGF